MKLRIKGNSVRLRLSQTEIQRLAADGALWDKTEFGDSTLHYGLALDEDSSSMTAAFDKDRIQVVLPAKVAHEWATSDQVSLLGEQDLAEGTLKLLVEKDFQCLKPREDEDESDLFPHPEG